MYAFGTMPLIAVVDDEEPVRRALKRLLRSAGLEAEDYASGQDFFAAERRADCVVLGLHLPVTTGLQVLQRIRQMTKRMPVIVISAHDQLQTREECMAAGAAAYLRKPLDERLLLNAISAALGAGTQVRR